MRYERYYRSARRGRLRARTLAGVDPSDLVAYSESFILTGEPESARATIARIRDERAAYLQAAKASRQFEDASFLEGGEIPAPSRSSVGWTFAVLRAAARASRSKADAQRVESFLDIASRHLSDAYLVSALIVGTDCYRNVGDLASSRRLLTRAFQIASGMKPHSPAPRSRDDQLVFSRRRQTAFHDLLRVADFWSHSLFLCSGTLLGFYRDGDFIPSDGDVDVGTTDSTGFLSLKESLKTSGRFYVGMGRLGSNIRATHVNGSKIDVSLYEDRPDGWAKTSHVYEWRFDKFELGELATDYGRLPVPVSTEDYLSAMYEDWWVPRAGYDSRIHSPNLTHVSPEEVALVMAGHYLSTYLRGGKMACAVWDRKFEGLPAPTYTHLSPLIQILD